MTLEQITPQQHEASRQFMVSAERLPTLYTLTEDMLKLLSLLDVAEDDEQWDSLELRRQELADKLLTKAEHYGAIVFELEHIAEGRKTETKRMAARAKRAEDGAAWLREQFLAFLKTSGQTRVETPRFTFALRQNPPSVSVIDPEAVPAEFERTTVITEADKQAILANYRATGEIPEGIEIVRTERLQIS